MKKKLLIGLAVVIGLVAVVVVAGLLILDPKALVAQKKDEVLQDLSAKIGRQVTAGDVTASVGSQLTARIVAIQVAGPPGKEAQPQLYIGSVDMRFSLLRALLSFGQDLYVERFTVQGLVVRAARDAEGKWDFDDILQKLEEDSAKEPEKDKKGGGILEDLRVASMKIINGRIELNDAMLGRPIAVGALNVESSDIVLGDPLNVNLKAMLEDRGKQSPIDVDAKLAVLPKDLSFDPLPDVEVKANLTDVDLGPWGGLIPPDVPAPVAGTLRTALNVTARDDAQKLGVNGTIFARGLVLRDKIGAVATQAERNAAPRGNALDADVNVELAVDKTAPRYEIKKLALTGSGLDLKATVDAKGTSLAALEKADVQATAQDLNRLLGALPPSLRGLPEAAKIDGPLAARLIANGNEIDASVNLDNARVRWLSIPDEDEVDAEGNTPPTTTSFDKPVGRALNLAVHGKKTSKALDIDKLALVVDKAKIGGTLSIPTDDESPLVADVSSGPVELASLKDLVPPFAEAMGQGRKIAGTAEVKVKATSDNGKQQADAAVELRSLDVNLSSTVVRGSGALTLKALPKDGDVDLAVTMNGDGLSIQKTGESGNLVVNKPSGLPLRLDVNAKKSKTKADVSKLALAIGRSTISGKGVVTALDTSDPRLDVDLGAVNVAFDDLKTAVPGASKLPSGGRMTGNVKLSGGTSTEKLVVDAKSANVTFGSSKIAGDVNIKNLSDPILDVKLPTIELTFDDLRPLTQGTRDLPAGGKFKGSLTMSGDTKKGNTVKADAKIDSLTGGGSAMSGTIHIENLDKPRFDLVLNASMLDVDKLRGTTGGEVEEPKKPKKKRENPHGLSKETRELLADVSGKGKVTATKAIVKGIPVQNFKGDLVMTKGVAKFQELEFDIYGGNMAANGSQLDLPSERTGYDLKLKGKDIDVGAAIADQMNIAKVFTGRVSPDIKLKGKGLAPGDFAISAEGPAELTFKSLSLSTLDLLGPIGEAVTSSGKLPKAFKMANPAQSGTTLDGFKALGQFVGGKLKLTKPVETESSIGKITWEGATGLSSGIDLKANLQLSPATIAKMTGNKVKPKDAIPVPVKITGTWDKPKVSGIDVNKLVAAILKEVAGGVIDKGEDAAKDAAKDILDDVTGKNDKKDDKKKDKKKKSTEEKAVDVVKGVLGK